MGADEVRTVRDLKAHQAVVLPMIAEHGGRVIDTAGDGILAEFGSAVNAVECAVAVQKSMVERNSDIPTDRRMELRIGVNLGDVIHDEERMYGDGSILPPAWRASPNRQAFASRQLCTIR
jgi:adenylate cyclase